MEQPERSSLTQAVKAEAHRLGFALAGVTTPEPPAHLEVFNNWLQQGRHGEMAYLASPRSLERRADPRRILPECHSILALATPYSPAGGPDPQGGDAWRGRTAAYAWGEDYHTALPARLQALVAFLEAQVGAPVPNRWYTDSGPLLERELAQRAGLGWIGKNTCLINPRRGSYFLLAEILLGLELESDPPMMADHCGSCRRCIEACPTGCILPDRTLQASACISYLTIELKGPVDPALRPQMGDWVFGCDICQQVCPWNRFAAPAGDPALDGPGERRRPDLEQALALTPEEFNRQFKGTAQKRAKRRGYLRSAALALGNQAAGAQDPRAAAALAKGLADAEPLVRGHAAWALGRLGGSPARQALEAAAARESDPWALAEMRAALEHIQ